MEHVKLVKSSFALASVLAICLVSVAAWADGTYATQASEARSRLEYAINHLSGSDKTSLEGMATDLESKGSELDELASSIDSKKQSVDDAQSAYDDANAKATNLRQQSDQATQDGQTRARQIAQSVSSICGQMGGSVSGTNCTFTCPEDQQAPCSQKVSSFNAQIAALQSQIESITQDAENSEQKATAAEAAADTEQQALQQAQSASDASTQKLDAKSAAFQQELQSFDESLTAAQKSVASPHLGSAFREAEDVLYHLKQNDQDCYQAKCSDVGANMDGTLIVPSTPTPAASASSQKYGKLQSDLQGLTSQYNDIHEKIRQATANHDPGVGKLVDQLSSIQGQIEFKAYTMKSYRVDMSQVAAP